MRDRTVVLTRRSRVAGPVNVVDAGGSGPPIVLVHGLGGSHVNWVTVTERLAEHGRVTAIDLIGHGRTPPAGRTSDIRSNRDLIRGYLEEHVDGPAILVGNSMGGVLSMLTAAASPEQVSGLVLAGPALPRTIDTIDPRLALLFGVYMIPGVSERIMRLRRRFLGIEGMVERTLEVCTVDIDRIPDEAYRRHVQMARERTDMSWAHESFLAATRSLLTLLARRGKVESIVRRIDAPGLIVQGERDRLVEVSSVRRLAEIRPDWELELLDDVGHVPQLETPERFLGVVEPWLERTLASAH